MPNEQSTSQFQSILAPLMEKFLQEKRACGYQYSEPARILRRLDSFLSKEGLTCAELPRFITKEWLSKTSHESPRTQQGRIIVVRQFSKYLCRLGYPAYVPDATLATRRNTDFVPRILTHEEMRTFLHAVDQLVATARSPLRHLIMPEIFRLLYGCGFRLGEVLNLRVQDVDLNQGVLTVLEIALPMPSSSRRPMEDRIDYGPFTAYFANCFCSVASPTEEGARDPESTIFAMDLRSILYCVGIERVQISMPNSLFWPPTWAIRTCRERSGIFILPRSFFLR